ncbi:MAG: hypothetical protein WC310_05060 [Patescibacteria group bacterium]|jgi:hypothetical protein
MNRETRITEIPDVGIKIEQLKKAEGIFGIKPIPGQIASIDSIAAAPDSQDLSTARIIIAQYNSYDDETNDMSITLNTTELDALIKGLIDLKKKLG